MKKLLCLLLVLALACSCAGCKEVSPLVQHTIDGLTITLPEQFVDLGDEEAFADYSFVFACSPIAISGIKEDRAALRANGLDPDLQEYTDLLIRAHGLDCQMLQTDGITFFNYEAGDTQAFTYVVTVWETPDAFWAVQAYCKSEDYAAARDEMWQYLSSITV